jgi:hypothetical protein
MTASQCVFEFIIKYMLIYGNFDETFKHSGLNI